VSPALAYNYLTKNWNALGDTFRTQAASAGAPALTSRG